MNPSEECTELKEYLLTVPGKISAGIQTQTELSKQYAKIGKNGAAPGEPNSLDFR